MTEKHPKKPQDLLKGIRQKIDRLDDEIVSLLNQRTQYALEIGKVKAEKGSETYAPDRESEVYYRLSQLSSKYLPPEALKAIYREVMSATLALERPLKIAYLGPEATFTHLASLSKFGSSVGYTSCASISDVFTEVEKKQADYGVVPIENSTEGAVSHTLDMFIDSDLKICSEIIFDISHCLMSNSQLSYIKRIYSKPEVFGQCRRWLEMHLPRVELLDTASTTLAAKRASQEDGSAAIASKLAATVYNLKLIAEGIEDSSHNRTRFLVIGKQFPKATGKDKTSIVVSIKDRMGALADLLEPTRAHKLNMTKIESRPSKKKAWDYYFFIDLEGHIEDPNVKSAIHEMEERVRFLKVLGSYPALREK
ncbi:MAG TPA: prephenate dehydratase [Candidatus Omnitrophota bacterium]|nr:prephenate dehydratase [Candidatus Omnitrophota bacterium]